MASAALAGASPLFTQPRPRPGRQLAKLGLQTTDFNAAPFVDTMTRLFGKGMAIREEDRTMPVGMSPIDDWNEVDSKYKDRPVLSLGTAVTQNMINEALGLGSIFVLAPPLISHERSWKVLFREIVQLAWSRIGPTGIPRTTAHYMWSETGGTARYGFYVSLPVELLADPNFGRENLDDLLEAVPQTANLTIMTEIGLLLAARPTYNIFWDADMRQESFLYADYYELAIKHFLRMAWRLNNMPIEIAQEMNTPNVKRNCMVIPDGCQWALAKKVVDNRTFEYKLRDYTGQVYALSEGLVTVGFGSQPQILLDGVAEPVTLVYLPRLKAHIFERNRHGLQPLDRELVLGTGYAFEAPDYQAVNQIDQRTPSMGMSVLTERIFQVQIVAAAQAIRKTRGGYVFGERRDPNAGFGPSDRMSTLLNNFKTRIGGQGEVDSWFQRHVRGMENTNRPSRENDTSLEVFHKLHHHDGPTAPGLITDVRSVPIMSDFEGTYETMEATDVVFARQIGHIQEMHLPTRRIVEAIQAVRRSCRDQGQPAAGMIPEFATKVAAILGTSADYVRLLSSRAAPIGIYKEGTPVPALPGEPVRRPAAENFLAQLIGYYEIVSEGRAIGDAQGRARSVAELPAERRPATHLPVELRERPIERFLSVLPDDSIRAFQRHAGLFERYLREQPDNATKFFGKLHEKAQSFIQEGVCNIDALNATMQFVMRSMEEKKLLSDTLLASDVALPILTPKMIKDLHVASPPQSELAAMKRTVPIASAEFSMSLAIKERFGASGIDIQPLGAAATNVGGPGALRDADSRTYPFSITRIKAMEEILTDLDPEILYVFVELCRLENSHETHARLFANGIVLIPGEIVRPREAFATKSFLITRSGGDTCNTVMSPMLSTVSTRGMQSLVEFKFWFSLGLFWLNGRNIDELRHVLCQGVRGGMTINFIERIEQVEELFNGNHADGDCVFVWKPVEEQHDRPCCLLPVVPVSHNMLQETNGQSVWRAKHSGYELLQGLLGYDFVSERARLMNYDEIFALTNGIAGSICPLIEDGPTWYFDVPQQRYSKKHSGTGPRGDHRAHSPAGERVYRGDEAQFPEQALEYPA
jgi:hypothetical protein